MLNKTSEEVELSIEDKKKGELENFTYFYK